MGFSLILQLCSSFDLLVEAPDYCDSQALASLLKTNTCLSAPSQSTLPVISGQFDWHLSLPLEESCKTKWRLPQPHMSH